MKLSTYREIIKKYYEINRRVCLKEMTDAFPHIPKSTVENIILQEYQRKTKRNHRRHHQPSVVAQYYERYKYAAQRREKIGFLIDIADEVDLSPALLARIILEEHYKSLSPDERAVSRNRISEHLKNTSLIDDGQLALEIYLCNLHDVNYGPISDIVRRTIGVEYENKLKSELETLGIAFIDESILRERGYDKTPDVKLEIPVAFENTVINWIESKASFGDGDRHDEYLRSQYWSYRNRFGPGLVIYWFGFIDEINLHKDQGIMISDSMPKNLIFMNPQSCL